MNNMKKYFIAYQYTLGDRGLLTTSQVIERARSIDSTQDLRDIEFRTGKEINRIDVSIISVSELPQ